jgi:hypothetical protein
MKRPYYLTLLVLGGILLVWFIDSLISWGSQEGGGLGEATRQIVAERRRRQRLEALDRATLRCLEGKFRVTEDLAAGRLRLEEAVELFARLEDERDQQLGRAPAAKGPERDARLRKNVETFLRIHQQSEKALRTQCAPEGPGPRIMAVEIATP